MLATAHRPGVLPPPLGQTGKEIQDDRHGLGVGLVWIRPEEQVLLSGHSGKQMTLGGYKPHPARGDVLRRDPGDVITVEENPT